MLRASTVSVALAELVLCSVAMMIAVELRRQEPSKDRKFTETGYRVSGSVRWNTLLQKVKTCGDSGLVGRAPGLY